MTNYQYVEIKPRKHSKTFETKTEAWAYWKKRFDKNQNWDPLTLPDINPKDFFDYKMVTLNKDGTVRKQTETRNWTKKQTINYGKAMKKHYEIKKEEAEELQKLKTKIELKLNNHLKKLGFEGHTRIKFFRRKK